MGILSTSVTDLNKLSKAQIVTAITTEQDTLRSKQRESRVVSQSGDTRGMLEQTTETRDGNGKLVGKRQVTWTYYPAGNVDTITITEIDGAGKVVGKPQVIKHSAAGGTMIGEALFDGEMAILREFT